MIALKTADLRKDIKRVSELVNAGEYVLVSRPRNENLVILSEKEFNRLERVYREQEKALDRERLLDIRELKKVLVPVFRANGTKRAILFGSRAKGTAGENSDIDLLVDSGLRGLARFGLIDDIAQATGMMVDLIDVADVKPGSRIDKEIKNTGVLIYEAD